MSESILKAQQAIRLGRLERAEQILAASANPDAGEAGLLFEVKIAAKKFDEALTLAADGFKQYDSWNQDARLLYLAATACAALNKPDDARVFLERCVELDSGRESAAALMGLAELYLGQHNLRGVEAVAPRLLEWPEYSIRASILLMKNAALMGDKALLARRCKALATRYDSIPADDFSAFIDYTIGSGCLAESQELLEKLESRAGKPLPLLRSAIEMERRNYGEVAALLSDQVVQDHPAVHYRKGMALDRLGEYASAFKQFSAGAAFRKSRVTGKSGSNLEDFHMLLGDQAFISRVMGAESHSNEPRLGFVFGFPRSGTTLLGNLLDTQSGLSVMPERPVLFFVKQAVSDTFGCSYPSDLPKLKDDELRQLRDLYLRKAAEMGFEMPANRMLIDKGPHHTVDLLLIRWLFPGARLILSLRHPLDVCLSCFQHDLEPNPNNDELITLTDIASRYRQVFSLLEAYREALQLDLLEVKYEDLVLDLDRQVEVIFRFLGLEEFEDYRAFHERATRNFIQSSSRGQADQPLYDSSVYKWTNYRSQLAPITPDLKAYIEKLAYPLDV
jgi:tetratricopeptide (TPR) repeat protein